ncbi:MAG: hypothetical protein D3905_14300 [Candidatus Electrothrix sp. AS4_5]|nr:hypothetical protein [Candidatus Electrothrix gigas]
MSKPFKPEMTEIFFKCVAPAIDFSGTTSFIDHGCGTTGVMSAWFIKQLSQPGTIYFTDIIESAITTTATVLRQVVDEEGKVIRLEPVLVRSNKDISVALPESGIDLLISNLAQFPLPHPDSDGYFVGKDGRDMITETLTTVLPHCLGADGAAYLSWTELSDLSKTLQQAAAAGLHAEIVASGEFPVYEKTWKQEYMRYLDQLVCIKDSLLDQFRTVRTDNRTTFTGNKHPYMLGGWLKITKKNE